MFEVTKYPHGIFCWVDLATPDPAAAKAFYAGLFGWQWRDVPTGGPDYTMLEIDGKAVAGLSGMSEEMLAQGMPAFWASYVNVDDADAIAERITAAGGTLMMPPMDVMEEGRMVYAQDPTGAAILAWQPRIHIGAQIVNAPNTLCWNELQTRDPQAAIAFYEAAFGWTATTDASNYTVFAVDGRRQAGMIEIDENWGPNIPANWGVYFRVTDLNAAVATAQELGGSVIVPPMSVGTTGTIAVISDPQGGAFSLIEGPPDSFDPAP